MSNIGSIGGGASRIDLTSGAGGTDAAAGAQRAEPVTLGSAELKANAALSQVASQGGTIAFGARGDAAKGVQEGLRKLGYLSGTADGVYGRGTQSAVADFQRKNGLTPSGDCDPSTLAALDKALQFGATKGASAAAPRNEIIFLGMGDGAVHEIKDLRNRGVAVAGITDTAKNDEVTLTTGGRVQKYDLTKTTEVDRYVKDLGVTGAKAKELAAIINGAGEDARDEAAQTVKAFLEAERGERRIERFVMSGHSVGTGVWGDSNGMFELETMEKICKAFPKAASQVQDFLVAGCYSSSERHVQQFRSMFPNLKTAMAYTNSAPGTWSGAMVHNSIWEQNTRGDDASKLDRDLFARTRKGENVAVWNAIDGYQSDAPARPIAQLRTELAQREPATRDYFSGAKNVENTQAGPLRDYYSTIQQMLGNPALPASEKPRMEQLRDATIRMIFYDHLVKGKFQSAYKTQIDAGFAALGMARPDFSKLSRKEALATIAEFEQKLAANNPKPQAALTLKPLLTDGLRDLKASVIPNNWV